MNTKRYFGAVAILLSTHANTQCLKLVLVKGQKFEVTTVTKVNSVSEIMGQTKENTTDRTTVQVIEVMDTRNTQTDLAVTITKSLVSLVSDDQEIKYDSESKDNPGMMVESFGKKLGKTENIIVDASGKVIKEKKSDQEPDANINIMMGVLPVDRIPIFQPTLIGREFIVNASWYDSVVTEIDKMKISTTGSYTIKNIENNIAHLVFTGIQKSTGKTEQMGQEFNITSTNKIYFEIEIEISTGIVMDQFSRTEGITNVDTGNMLIPVTLQSSSLMRTKVY